MRATAGGLVLVLALTVPLSACSAPAPEPLEPVGVRIAVPDAGCPRSVEGAQDVVAAPRSSTLLPDPTTVSSAVICEYASTAGRRRTGGRLRREVDLPQDDARRLAAAVHALRIVRAAGPAACPEDTGTVALLAFRRPGRVPDADLWWRTSGCQTLDDGTLRTEQLGDPSFGAFQRLVARLTPAPH